MGHNGYAVICFPREKVSFRDLGKKIILVMCLSLGMAPAGWNLTHANLDKHMQI